MRHHYSYQPGLIGSTSGHWLGSAGLSFILMYCVHRIADMFKVCIEAEASVQENKSLRRHFGNILYCVSSPSLPRMVAWLYDVFVPLFPLNGGED